MHINDLDLNLLRVFDTVYRLRSVSRAADLLGLSQPATSQALTRLRLLLKDALFVRALGGVQPTPKADRLAQAVRLAISTLQSALGEAEHFDPASSTKEFRLHLSDIGEARFLPGLMAALHQRAPGVRVQSFALPHDEITAALDDGRLDAAIGFLPAVQDTQTTELINDRYAVLLREGHPAVAGQRVRSADMKLLGRLEYVAVRSHSETLRILQLLRLEAQVRLTAAFFLALPAIVKSTDLCVVMPRNIALDFAAEGGYTVVEPQLPLRNFTVALHWSRRFQADPALLWLRQLVVELFSAPVAR
jgi:DNA-binding transcriptional LysR family regulator